MRICSFRGSRVRWYLLGCMVGLALGFLLTANIFPTLDGRRSINHSKNEPDDAIKEAVDAVFNTEKNATVYALHMCVQGTNLTRWSKVYENQLKRQQILAGACKELGMESTTPDFRKSDMYFNDTLKFFYCAVSKASCTTWKRVLLQAIHPMKADQAEEILTKHYVHGSMVDSYLERTRHFTLEDIKLRLLTHFKFLFVRHPLERLVSAHRDKFTRPRPDAYDSREYHERFGVKIIKAFRTNASKEALLKGRDVKFGEMIRYMLAVNTSSNDSLLSDQHWQKQHEACHPCSVRYDFIGHYETLVDDALFVLERLGLSDRVRFPNVDPDNMWKNKTADIVAELFGGIEPAELEGVRKLYDVDFRLLGYDRNTFTSRQRSR